MLIAALRDLQWRRRRFLIAVVGTSFVFAMTLVLTGLANGFRVEASNTGFFGIRRTGCVEQPRDDLPIPCHNPRIPNGAERKRYFGGRVPA